VRRPAWRRTLAKWTDFGVSDLARWSGFLIEGLLIAMLVLAPLPLGSVAPWARSVLFLGACLLLSLWVVRSCLQGRLEIVRTSAWFFAGAYLLVLFLQLVPLPHALLSGLSPRAAEIYTSLVPGYPERTGMMSVSLNPYATVQEIYRILTFAVVLFVFLNHFRERRQVARVLWALVAIGLFQALYGLAERFSGNPRIFWVALRDTVSVHGTYYNRNHFAGLMEMLTPAVFGFFLASLASQSRSWRSTQLSLFQRIEQALSKGRGYRNLLLGMVVAAMFLAGMFSLSRGGAAGLLVGFLVLFGFTQGRGEKRARVLRIFVFVLLAALGLLFYRGVDQIVDRFEQLAEEESSWEGRQALRKAGARMFGDFPLLGVGGGAFRYVFPAYQPDRYGNRAARYLHNDWLQVACETGALGAAVAYAGIGVFLFVLLRTLRRRQDPYCRLIFAGAFAGVVAMLLHSFFDFNLYMVTANGLVFTVLLGICHSAAHMKGRSRGSDEGFRVWGVEFGGVGLRVGVPLAVLAGCAVVSIPAVQSGMADVAFGRYRAWAEGRPDHYFFWECPRPDEDEARASLGRALSLQPGSPEHNFAMGVDRVRSIREKILAEARERARAAYLQRPSAGRGDDAVEALALDIERTVERETQPPDEEGEAFQELVSAFTDPARRGMQAEIRNDLEEAEESFRAAMRMAPTVPWYRMTLAMAYADLLAPGPLLEQERPKVERLVEQALALAPNRPASLFAAARYDAGRILEETGRIEEGRDRDRQVLAMFRRALEAEPVRYAYPTYEFLVEEAMADPGLLFGITPETLASQRRLQWFLSRRGMWPEALEATGNVLALLGLDPGGSDVPDLAAESRAFRLCLVTTKQQVRMLRRLGRIEPWRVARNRYRSLLRIRCDALLEDAARYAGLGRFAEARKACTDCLDLDGNRLEALLTMQEIALLPGAAQGRDREEAGFVQDLLRLAEARPGSVRAAGCGRIGDILPGLTPETPVEHLEARLLEALVQRVCGDPGESVRLLRALLLVDAKPFVYWHQRHLLHYHLGRSLEAWGALKEEAALEYEKALGLAPAHRASLERLVGLGRGDDVPGGREVDSEAEPVEIETSPTVSPTVKERLEMLTPEIPWGIDLEGKIAFVGMSLDGAEAGATGFKARYYWEIAADLDPREYFVAYRYFDGEGDRIFQEWKTLFPNPREYGRNLDGGIGTVLLHWHYLPFSPEIVGEVYVLVRKKRKGKLVHPPLHSLIGDRWLILGLPGDSDFLEKNP
jgi:O-antigen ligase/tetratricopeptide (TPR) repeat protein